ncbi:MAG: DUF2480 family protein [Bacteroidota bacterium]|nr:DUF2480 family protein [Bacteroidota bacterium]
MNDITNKVASSGLITIDPADYSPKGTRAVVDIKPLLVEEFLLREKDFREYVKTTDWSGYAGQFVAITCSNDAIIPVWAYMLLAAALEPYAAKIVFGDAQALEAVLFSEQLSKIQPAQYRDQRIVIKGCGDVYVPVSAYMELTRLLKPVAKTIMYGEPCSTVPVYKAK